jgi:hypothetical protein
VELCKGDPSWSFLCRPTTTVLASSWGWVFSSGYHYGYQSDYSAVHWAVADFFQKKSLEQIDNRLVLSLGLFMFTDNLKLSVKSLSFTLALGLFSPPIPPCLSGISKVIKFY